MTLEETEGNLTSMAELAKASGIQVILASVIADLRLLSQTDRSPEKGGMIVELNTWMEGYAKQNGFVGISITTTALLDDHEGIQERTDLTDRFAPE